MATAYCMKCRKKIEIKDPREITLKNKRLAVAGRCPVCGTKVFRIGKL
jgi:DNA-directed RNA polymerase subunit RPC12/RpoP